MPRIVHEEQSHAIIIGKIAQRDILPIAAEIGKAQCLLIENPNKARRAAAMLDVGPARFADGRQINAVTSGDEVPFRIAESIVMKRARL